MGQTTIFGAPKALFRIKARSTLTILVVNIGLWRWRRAANQYGAPESAAAFPARGGGTFRLLAEACGTDLRQTLDLPHLPAARNRKRLVSRQKQTARLGDEAGRDDC
ncbi:MAG: hypothetical protein J0J10_18920 [Bosea sp.]|jgi:hypothetical protein|uniref:hypothetical protein n=1 Tax=Bosea sp. (in: a-proteobacteria) TaxID=1871050 RepID=UPI001AC7F875|nr:hypothetical protein [Bosea sp. (in: a-proteobacteria)]MBN9470845.1 hypothetical protein [Bosea sp. (in: a-proteobacteria)]